MRQPRERFVAPRTGFRLEVSSQTGRVACSRKLPQLFQDDRIDLCGSVHALFEVSVAGPLVEGILELAVVAELRQSVAEFVRERVVDRQPLVPRRLAEERLVQPVEASKLFERQLVILDPELNDRVRKLRVAAVLLDDQQRSRLLAAPVAAETRMLPCAA